jgi:hypothetical protein
MGFDQGRFTNRSAKPFSPSTTFSLPLVATRAYRKRLVRPPTFRILLRLRYRGAVDG